MGSTAVQPGAEHRTAERPSDRTGVVESGPLFSLLFLNNNLHSPHHADARLAWYDLPAWYRENREAFLAGNGGYVFAGYREQARRFMVKPKDAPLHPYVEAEAA